MSEIRRVQPNLFPNSRYVVRVRAINAFNVPSEWSDSFVFTTPLDATVPLAPTNVIASWDKTSLNIRWTAPTLNNDNSNFVDFKNYEVRLTANSIVKSYFVTDTSMPYSGSQNTADFGTLQPIVDIAVRAYDYSGNASPWAMTQAVNAIPPNPTQAPILATSYNGITVTMIRPVEIDDYKSFLLEHGSSAVGPFTQIAEVEATDTYFHQVDDGVPNHYRYKIKDLFNQTSAGYSPVAGSTIPAVIEIPDKEVAYFSQSGTLSVTATGDCPVYDVEAGGQITDIKVNLKVAGTSASTFTAYKNDVLIGTVTIGIGATEISQPITPVTAIAGDNLHVMCTAAGIGAKSASVKIRMLEVLV